MASLFLEGPSARAQVPGWHRFPFPALIVFALQAPDFAVDCCFDQFSHGLVSFGLTGGEERTANLVSAFDSEVGGSRPVSAYSLPVSVGSGISTNLRGWSTFPKSLNSRLAG